MAKYILFRDYKTFVPENIVFDKVISYKNDTDSDAKDFYIITPEFKVLNYEHSPDNDFIYITILFNNSDFLNVITLIDNLAIQHYSETNNISTHRIIRNFVPTRLLDSISSQYNVIELVIPIICGKPLIKVYDEASDPIPVEMIDMGFRGRAIIQPKGIIKANGTYSSGWSTDQIKVVIPEVYFDRCILNDENNDDIKVL